MKLIPMTKFEKPKSASQGFSVGARPDNMNLARIVSILISNFSELDMKKRLVLLFSVTLIASLILAGPAAAYDGKGHGGLQPGETITYEQKIPINIVFIGYDRNTIDRNEILDQLPAAYAPVVRYPQFYGLPGRDMGLKFNFKYNFSFADSRFSTNFFRYLKQIGVPGDPTVFQTDYNDQINNVLDVAGPVLYIDAPSVEKWLARNLEQKQGYTIVFINWYSRPDFKFHLFTKTDEADPDTGYNFGEIRDSRKIIAWGGSYSRLWFYDLSAGPEAWTDNWNVDDPDLDGNAIEDYRMPPIWEYAANGYRDPSALSSDLGLVARFVGIDLLFTTSPLYDPLVTAPDAYGDKVVHINMLEDDPDSLGTDWIDTGLIRKQFAKFQPYYDWRTRLVDHNPIDPGAQRAFRIFADVLVEDDCWNDYLTTFAELFCYFDSNRAAYIPAYDEADYVAGIYAINTTGENLGSQFGLLGFADDNWVDGTQSYVFEFDSAEYRDIGYGFSTTTIHEGGHHFGMSHPHDGYDSEFGLDYGPGDDFYFAWSGDESNTIMHYMDLSIEFGQFDQDNMYRWEMAGYLNWSNALLADILAHPNSKKVKDNISKAENYAEQAIKSFDKWNYLDAAAKAHRAYDELAKAADKLGIETPTAAAGLLRIAPNLNVPHEGDPIRFPDN